MDKLYFIIGLIIIALVISFIGHKYNNGVAVEKGVVINIYIDSDFNRAEKIEIKRAIAEWNKTLNGNLKLTIRETTIDIGMLKKAYIENGIVIGKVYSWDINYEGNGDLLGFTDSLGGNLIHIIADKVRGILYGVVLHELGHALGGKHTESGLMYKYYNGYFCVDKTSAEEIAKYWNFNVESMKYCLDYN